MKQVKLICTLALALVALAACNPFDQAGPNPAGSNPQESTANVILNLNLAPMDAPGTKGTTKQA